MDRNTASTRFEDTPSASAPFDGTPSHLITPERLAADPRVALSVLPPWLHAIHLEYPEGHDEDEARFTPSATLVLGRSRVAAKGYSLLQVAFLFELTRLPGISIVTNHNGSGRHYERIAIAGHPEDLTSVNRVFVGAAEYTQAKVSGIQSDMRAENLRTDAAEKVSKDARHVVLGHAERIAKEWEKKGRTPRHLTASAYLDNLHRLLRLIDLEATGRELSDLLPIIPTERKG